MTAPGKFIGRSVPRLEDRPLLLGRGRFAADVNFPGQWHMRVVRSPVAHGKIKSIDATAALALPGVHAVWTLCRRRAYPAHRLPADRAHCFGALPAVGIGGPRRALCRRAGRRRVRRGSIHRRGRCRPGRARYRAAARHSRCRGCAGSVRHGAQHRADGDREKIRRHRCGLPRGARDRRARSYDRPAQRRAAGNARRHRALRRSQGRAGNARRRQGAALEPRPAGADVRARTPTRCSSTRAMSAAVSASAAKCIRKTCWSAPPRSNSAGRSNG